MAEQPDGPRDLDTRIRNARARRSGQDRPPPERGMGGVGIAMRLAVDVVAALVVGVAIGVALDRWLGTSPWLLIVFIVLGAAAGMLNVYRTALKLEEERKARTED